MVTSEQNSIAQNVALVRSHIEQAAQRSHRNPALVRLVAVSKTVPVSRIVSALRAGIVDLGENRVQEAESKIGAIETSGDVSWHLIGHLQTNKVRKARELFDFVHSVDSVDLARRLSQRVNAAQQSSPYCLLEVNVSGEATKQGFTIEQVQQSFGEISEMLGQRVVGLMTIAPHVTDPNDARFIFRQLRELRDRLEQASGQELPELSMGMSNDYVVAIEEGATMVRIGTAIFGQRLQ